GGRRFARDRRGARHDAPQGRQPRRPKEGRRRARVVPDDARDPSGLSGIAARRQEPGRAAGRGRCARRGGEAVGGSEHDPVAAREGGGSPGERLRARQGGVRAEGHLLLTEASGTSMTSGRLSLTMNTLKFPARETAPDVPSVRAGRLAVWILLGLGLLLMLVSASKGEQATRVTTVNGTLSSGQTLQVQNVSGDVVVSPGKQFSAVVTLTASAATKAKAEELLSRTRIEQSHDED